MKKLIIVLLALALALSPIIMSCSSKEETGTSDVEYFSGRDCDLDKLKKALEFNFSHIAAVSKEDVEKKLSELED